MTERQPRGFDEARNYFEQCFEHASDIIGHVTHSWANDPAATNTDLPFDVVRVIGEEERNALMNELLAHARAATTSLVEIGELRQVTISDIEPIMMSLMFLSWSAGYRHSIEENVPVSVD